MTLKPQNESPSAGLCKGEKIPGQKSGSLSREDWWTRYGGAKNKRPAQGFYCNIYSVTSSDFSMPKEVKHNSWVLIKAKKKKKGC